jgi:serine/threonine-protein kinase
MTFRDGPATRLAAALAGRYRVERELGAGGMATVYLAHDLRHGRDVAIKVLHPDLGAAVGAERFLGEIRTTARLQHPHILPLLDSGAADGLLFYVMPFVRGETLRARLERDRQLPIADAVRIARDVAGALDHAHRQGVIHRDIKPENILLQDGAAVVADFGIALAVQSAGGQRLTQTGLSLGTPQYMSPEQAMGERTVDARSDIYALGAVTYEMLTGEAPFTGNGVQAIVAKVLTERPVPVRTLRDTVPEDVSDALLMALAKLPADRFPTAAAFAAALRDGASSHPRTGPRTAGGPARSTRSVRSVVVGAALLALGAAGGACGMGSVRAPGGRGYTIAHLTPPPGEHWYRSGAGIALSPDGRTLAVISSTVGDAPGRIMLRRLDRFDARVIPGTDGATYPFWSPDGRSLGFHANAALQIVDVATNQVRRLCPVWTFNGGTWNQRGDIVFSSISTLHRARVDGGGCTALRRPLGDSLNVRPTFLSDGDRFLIATWRGAYVARLSDDRVVRLDAQLTGQPVLASDNEILTSNTEGDPVVRRFDMATGRALDAGLRLVASSVWSPWGETTASISKEGTMVLAGPGERIGKALAFVDRAGMTMDTLAVTSPSWVARLSPDARTLAIGGFNVRLLDIATRRLTELAAAPGNALGAVLGRPPTWGAAGTLWMRDIFDRRATRVLTIAGERWRDDSMPVPAGDRFARLNDRAADGRFTYWEVNSSAAHPAASIWRRDEVTGKSEVLVDEPVDVEFPRVSPDGRWLAYTMCTGGDWQVFIRPVTGSAGARRVSRTGGRLPTWRADSRELFFATPDRRIMAASVSPAGEASEPTVAFESSYLASQIGILSLDASADGRHFYMLLDTGGMRGFSVILNWPALARAAESAP